MFLCEEGGLAAVDGIQYHIFQYLVHDMYNKNLRSVL